jgi:CheY-like chemotaxis protein
MKERTETRGQSGQLLEQLQQTGLIPAEDWQALAPALRAELANHNNARLMARLVDEELLTSYQASMIAAGKIQHLILGNYRVRNRLGVGDMAVVFLAEHCKSRHEVAIKVMSPATCQDPNALLRFVAERKTIAQLRHPNIVNALDIGEQEMPGSPDHAKLYYYVMEHVAGQDLEHVVKENGPLPPERAFEIVYQVAGALAEAHRHRLVHRNVEPANILVTDDGKVKLLDFGLARQFVGRMTQPGTSLGGLDYIAPEQTTDASTVDIRADIYSLGATLFWCLTGQPPYTFLGRKARDLSIRLTTPPQGPKTVRPEIADPVDAIVLKMLALEPEGRYATPEEVLQALEPLLPPGSEAVQAAHAPSSPAPALPAAPPAPAAPPLPTEAPPAPHVLIVDKDEATRQACRQAVEREGLKCDEAASGKEAAAAVAAHPPDIVLLADQLPDQPGVAVLRAVRQTSAPLYQKVIMLVGSGPNAVKQVLAAGADDYLVKPLDADQLQARLKTACQLKEAQDRADGLARELAAKLAPPPPEKTPSARSGLFGKLKGLFSKR